MRYLDGRDGLRWYQHRHPEPQVRMLGIALMVVGLVQIVVGIVAVATG